MENKLIIIDSNSLLHRAFHALPELTTQRGEQTGAIYGFLLILLKAIKDLDANCIVACFDTKVKTFRHEKYEEYKAHRPRTPDGISSQLPRLKEVLQSLRIPIFAKDGVEADDLIATISTILKNEKETEVYILSGDLDNLQLVDEKIKVYTLGKGIKDTVLYDEKRVKERFGVTPSQMNDFKALTGDASDNVPGVPGIGKTTAADIIQRYGNIENLYQELSTDTAVLKPKVKELLRANKEKAFLSKELVCMKRDVDIDFNLKNCRFGNFNWQETEKLLKDLEFNSLLGRLYVFKKNN